MRTFVLAAALSIGWIATGSIADACPMCSAAVESGQSTYSGNVPAAFNTSILFMLSVPYFLLGCFGFAFYRLSRRHHVSDPTAPVDAHLQ
jgi:hypothetical protein